MYFEGHTTSRVIFVHNMFFDAGSITYLCLFGIQYWTGATTSAILGGYLGLGVVLYGSFCYFWAVTDPLEPAAEEDQEDTGGEGTDFNAVRKLRPRPSTRFSRLETSMTPMELEDALKSNLGRRLSRTITTRNINNFSRRSFRWSGLFSSLEIENVNPDDNPENEKSSPSKYDSASTARLTLEENDVAKHATENEASATTTVKRSDGYTLVADRGPKLQLTSTPFLLLCCFFGLQVGADWNLATQRDFLASLGDDDNLYLTIFTLCGPLSILGAPFVDRAILKFGWSMALQSVNLLAIGYQTIKVASDNLNVQIVGFVIFSFYRSFLFGVTYSFLPTLIGESIVSRAAGILTGAGGALNLLLIPLVDVAVKNDDGDFFVTNMVFLFLTIPSIVVICFLGRFIELENLAKARKISNP